MIDLKFGKYGIKTADKLNIMLYELLEVKKKDSPNFVKISEKVLGYFSHLEHALNAYVKVTVADDDFNATSIEEVKVLLTEIKEKIHAECERIENERRDTGNSPKMGF